MTESTEIEVVGLPQGDAVRRDLPKYEDVPRTPATWKKHGDEQCQRYDEERKYDLNLLLAVAVAAYDDGKAPKPGDYIALTLAGAIRFATKGELVSPSCNKESGYRFTEGIWQLAWEALLESDFPKKIKDSLSRLLVAKHVPGCGHYEENTDENDAMRLWQQSELCPGTGSTNQLVLWAYKNGSSYKAHFTPREQRAIEKLFPGAKLMGEKILSEAMSRYMW